jgi:hypothetical protein
MYRFPYKYVIDLLGAPSLVFVHSLQTFHKKLHMTEWLVRMYIHLLIGKTMQLFPTY